MRADDSAQVQAVLDDFAKRLGWPGLPLSEDGACALTAEGGLALTLEFDAEGSALHLVASLGVLGPEERQARLERALAANLSETGEARFALDPETDELLLCASVMATGLDIRAFETTLANFLADCAAWREWLRGVPASEATTGGFGKPFGRRAGVIPV